MWNVTSGFLRANIGVNNGIRLISGPLIMLTNGLIAVAVYRQQSLRTSSSKLLAILALADFGMGFFTLLGGIIESCLAMYGRLDYSVPACFAYFLIPRSLFINASNWLVAALAFDRWAMIVLPLWYHELKKKRYLQVVSGVSGAISLVVAISYVLGISMAFEEYQICEPYYVVKRSHVNATAPLQLLPPVLMVVLSLWSIIVAKKKTVQSPSNTNQERIARFQSSVAIIVTVYLASWGLMVVTQVVQEQLDPTIEGEPLHVNHLLLQSFHFILVTINACSNLVIYYSRNREFRQAFRIILRISGADEVESM